MPNLGDGGPAFPRAGFYPDTSDVHSEDLLDCLATKTEPNVGMSLRDWFAGRFLQGMLSSGKVLTPAKEGFEDAIPRLAALAYAYADAMLAEREKRS